MTRREGKPTDRELPKAYLRLDPDIDSKHPDHLDAFIHLLCAANRQRPRGRFANRHALEAQFGRLAVKRFYARGDVEDMPDGRVYMTGWDAWQEGDMTVAERVRRCRAGRGPRVTPPLPDRDNVTRESVTGAFPEPLSKRFPTRNGPSSRESLESTYRDKGDIRAGDALSRRAPEPTDAAESWLAAHGAMRGHLTAGLSSKLGELVVRHGEPKVLGTLDRLVADHGPMTAREFVFGAENVLNVPPGSRNGKAPMQAIASSSSWDGNNNDRYDDEETI